MKYMQIKVKTEKKKKKKEKEKKNNGLEFSNLGSDLDIQVNEA